MNVRVSMATAAAASLVGCSRPARPAQYPPVIEESTAISVIERAYVAGGHRPSEGRDLHLSSGRTLRIDVGTAGHKYGVAFLTKEDTASLDAARDLPPPMGRDDLPVVQGAGPDADAVVLVLRVSRYSSAAPEQSLERDVRDFLVQARTHHLP
jgi:hypothetical protein